MRREKLRRSLLLIPVLPIVNLFLLHSLALSSLIQNQLFSPCCVLSILNGGYRWGFVELPHSDPFERNAF